MRRDAAAAGKIPVDLCHPGAFREAFLVRGTVLRIAELRSESAYIRVAVRRTTLSRRMVEPSATLPRLERVSRRSSRLDLRAALSHEADSHPPAH